PLALRLFLAFDLSLPTAIALVAVVVCSAPMQIVFRQVWSETLFVPLMLAWVWYGGRYFEHGHRRDLWGAAWFLALCLLTRHAGVAVAFAMSINLLLPALQRRRLPRAGPVLVLVCATLPYTLWLL